MLFEYAQVIEARLGIQRVVPVPRPVHNNLVADVNQNDPFQGKVAKDQEEENALEKLVNTRQWVLGTPHFSKEKMKKH